jgi:putative transcriptional regulator
MTDRVEFHIKGRKRAPEPYHFKTVGLPNIYLLNGFRFEDDPHYGRMVHFTNLDGLHRAIGLHLIEKSDLTGDEFKFLRKQLNLTQAQLGKQMGVTDQTVANYEKGKTGTGPAIAYLRIAYLVRIIAKDSIKSVSAARKMRAIEEALSSTSSEERHHAIRDPYRHKIAKGWDELPIAA